MISYRVRNQKKNLRIQTGIRDHSISASESSNDNKQDKKDDKQSSLGLLSPQSPIRAINLSNAGRTSVGTAIEEFFNDDFRNHTLQNWSIRCFWKLKPKQNSAQSTEVYWTSPSAISVHPDQEL